MKKIFNLILAALVIIVAAACTKNEEVVSEPQGESLSFYAEVVNGDTRAYIDDADGDKTWNTIWEEGDAVYVGTDNADPYIFTYTNGKFTCSEQGVTSLIGQSVTVGPYQVNDDSTAGKSAWSFTGTRVENFDADVKVQLTADTSFFRYTYNGTGEVTITVAPANELTKVFRYCEEEDVLDYFSSITLKGAATDKFVGFWPQTLSGLEATLSYSINGVKCKETSITLATGKVYNLGTLTDPVATEYGVVGSFQGWDVAAGKTVTMYEAKDGWCVARNIELYKDDEIKIVKGNSWDVSYGPSAAGVLEVGVEHDVVSENSQNIKVAKNGKFDVHFNPTTNKFKYECVEEYTDLMVNITINNKANWNPLYIILKSGDTLLTAASGNLVSGNKYAVSGDYIGSSLNYQFVSGSKKSEAANVTITRNGATVMLEETIIKLKVQLNTDNSKQWWGNTMKIHVWNTGTSFDTSWPGTVMTFEGNYTWSINVPSELVGKTINYLVHNGNGWQSKDATVTISAKGNTITGSSININ
ncbi:MAG: hypothetical protein IJW88_03790 [Alistipes sp.]|nr:hypothetical protein [Alistipes sp.]